MPVLSGKSMRPHMHEGREAKRGQRAKGSPSGVCLTLTDFQKRPNVFSAPDAASGRSKCQQSLTREGRKKIVNQENATDGSSR